jgi:hypothetical protein
MKIKFTIIILVTSWTLISLTACSPQTNSVTASPQATSELVDEDEQNTALDNSEPIGPSPTDTSTSTQTPTVDPSSPAMLSTPENGLEVEVENEMLSITPTPTQTLALNGYLYLRTPTGIARFSLLTEEIEDLVTKEPDWDMSFAFSPDRQQLAYWLHGEERSELWVTKLTEWSPELVFTVSGIEHEWNGLWWLNDQYLVFEPGYWNQGVHFFIPVRSYLINVPQQKVELETGSLIFGCSLALSPQSEQIATWCPAIEGWSDPQEYFLHPPSYYVVLEGNGEYWLSEPSPTDVLVEYRERPEQLWSWSYTGKYVAFSTYDAVARVRTLYYLDAQGQSLIAVEDDPYHAWDWSPDQRYISFVGRCPPGSCNKVFDRESQQVAWTSRDLPGVTNATSLNWSYDSNYIAVWSEGITIIDVETGERVRNFKDLSGAVIVWSP